MVRRLVTSLTPTGRFVTVAAFGCSILGMVLGWGEFQMLGTASILAVIIGALWVSRAVPLGITRTLHPNKVTVGGSSLGIVEVRNTTRRYSGARAAEDRIGDQVVRLDLPSIAPGQRFEAPYSVFGRTRGLMEIGPVTLTRSDPLRLFRVVQSQGSLEHLWVRPRVHILPPASTGWAKDREGPTSDVSPRGSAAFHALREYQRGDDLRHVHWRTSARMDRLMVRHFVDTRYTQELILLDTRAESYLENSFEDAVEITASIGRASEAAGRQALLLLPGQAESSNRSPELLDRLTLVQAKADLRIDEIFRSVPRSTDVSGFVVITGDSDANEVVARSKALARGRSVLVVRCRPSLKESSMSIVSGCAVLDTPSAVSLAGAWSQAVVRV